MNTLGKGKSHLAGVVVDHKLYRHTAPVEPYRVSGAAVDLELDGRHRRTVDLYRRFLSAADAHLLQLARIGTHHHVGAEEIGRPRIGRMNRGRGHDGAVFRRGDDKVVAARLAFYLGGAIAFVGDPVKRNEPVTLPALRALGIFVVNPYAEHTDLEMRLGLDGRAVPPGLDRVGVSADFTED